MDYRYNAESWGEFVEFLRATRTRRGYLASEKTSDPEWSGSADWPGAVHLAIHGSQVARTAMDQALVKVSGEPEPLWDVAPIGAFPCIPAYAAGVPEDMFCPSEDAPPVQSPIVRIAINTAVSCSVDPEAIIRRGAAIVTLIDRIQLSGRRVELVAFWHADHRSGSDRYLFSCTVKRPEEPVDMDRIAFALASPAMVRRCFFRVMECVVPREVPGYGIPRFFRDEFAGFDLVLEGIGYREGNYETQDGANARVLELWNKTQGAAA